MGYFSVEEFKILQDELTGEVKRHDMLIKLARKTLLGAVYNWCRQYPTLKGCGYEEDIMQNICLRLIKYCGYDFKFKTDDLEQNSREFKSWLFAVAINEFTDFKKKKDRIYFNESEMFENSSEPTHETVLTFIENERLLNAFETVITSSSKAYIIITWLAAMIFIATENIGRIQANKILFDRFTQMTLDEMYDFVEKKLIKMMIIPPDSDIMKSLKNKLDDKKNGQRTGNMKYGDFYMKKGGISSISDWINRMNNYIDNEDNGGE